MATELTAVDYLTRSVDRNRYFYGKLMTVRDFSREQDYFNSKRWLINRLLFGSGIVCGLEVGTTADGPTVVEIQPGVAFDPLGQEITVSERARVDLAKLVTETLRTGLPGGGTADVNLHVCLDYHECPKEPVPSLGGSPCEESCESNRVGETYTVKLMTAPSDPEHTACERWLNRQTVRRPQGKPADPSDNFQVERIAPVWVRQNAVFEVALKVTALKDVNNVSLSETAAGGTIIEPNPQTPGQFPGTPVSLRQGEFFVYVYQVQAPAASGDIQLAGTGAVPTPPAKVHVVDEQTAKANEAEMYLGACPGQPEVTCVPVARIKAGFESGTLKTVTLLEDPDQQRFRYSLVQVTGLLDCVGASLRAEAESPRPGHLFITFKDLEQNDLQPIGPAADHGDSWTVTRGDHVHALLLYTDSGLKFEGNQLRIEGNVGGSKINFLNPVSGQDPVEPQHLTTRHYVDARIAGLDWQESVITRKLSAPPTPPPDPKDGDRYLIPGNPGDPSKAIPRNPWATHPGNIATWNGKNWDYTNPDEGTAVFVDDENIAYLFVDGKWIPFLATPEVAAGEGLWANGAVLNVGQGAGLKVNPNDVEVVYEANLPQPVGQLPAAGTAATASRGDHTHELPLTKNGGLIYGQLIEPSPVPEIPVGDFRAGLHIDGFVRGPNIDFLHPVLGRTPTDPRHLATKGYVDGVAAGLDWQNSVLSKNLIAPPDKPEAGARYLVINTGGIFRIGFPPFFEEAAESLSDEERAALAGKLEEALSARPPEPDPIPPPPPPTNGENGEPPPPPPVPDPLPIPRPVNPWRGHENSITTWDGSTWTFTPPNEGMAVFVEDENTAYLFVDGKWTAFMAMPQVAAGAGLYADGARLSVGQGSGLIVSENSVDVAYHAANPTPVGPATFPGASGALARGDHSHELPLAQSGGLEFIAGKVVDGGPVESIRAGDETNGSGGRMSLRVNGRINGDAIEFLNPVLGQDPLDPRHLATKQYVDGVTAGLTWQNTVLDKDATKPPDTPTKGDRYLLNDKPAAGSPWEGQQGNIATWTGRKWDFTAPLEGMATFVADENLAYLYADGKWVQFLAPPAAVGAGAGLIQSGTDLAVGQGQGVLVSADAVSIDFGNQQPLPVGPGLSNAGASNNPARVDHRHELPLVPDGGLVFVKSLDADRVRTIVGLKIDGRVDGPNVNFLHPVLGQTPTDPNHLATKGYVDAKGGGGGTVAAGDGLVNNANGLSVVAGPGLVVSPDEVHVNFEDGNPQPVGTFTSPGKLNTVARGDHTHAMPDVWGTSVATGVVAFNMRQAGKQVFITSLPIDPRLGAGTIAVVVGLESDVAGGGTFVGEIDNFEDAMSSSGDFRHYPSILLGASIQPPNISRGPFGSTTFQIWAHATPRAEILPDAFRVRWWAYRPGQDLGVIDYMPPAPTFVR